MFSHIAILTVLAWGSGASCYSTLRTHFLYPHAVTQLIVCSSAEWIESYTVKQTPRSWKNSPAALREPPGWWIHPELMEKDLWSNWTFYSTQNWTSSCTVASCTHSWTCSPCSSNNNNSNKKKIVCVFQHTHFQLFSEDGPLAEGGTVPASVPELKLTLVDAHLCSFSYHDDGVRTTLADDPLSWCKSWDFVADDAGSQSDHWREPSTVDPKYIVHKSAVREPSPHALLFTPQIRNKGTKRYFSLSTFLWRRYTFWKSNKLTLRSPEGTFSLKASSTYTMWHLYSWNTTTWGTTWIFLEPFCWKKYRAVPLFQREAFVVVTICFACLCLCFLLLMYITVPFLQTNIFT